MNKKLLLITACLTALLLCICALAACNKNGPETGTEASASGDTAPDGSQPAGETGDTTDTTDGTGTIGSVNDDVTAIPRYDYFEPDVAPDVTIDKSVYTDMKLTIPASLEIKDSDVKDYIKHGIVFGNRVAVDGSTQVTDKAMKEGDSAFIYYKGFIGGEPLENGSNWEDTAPFELGLGSASFIPGFEDALIGVIPADASKENPKVIDLTFPADYDNQEIAGKAVTFHVAVEYAIQYTLPTYDKAFIVDTLTYEPKEEFYASDAALIKEFEAYVKTVLEEKNAENVEYAKTDALWMYLTAAAECRNLNQSELDFYYNSYISEIEYYYNQYSTYYGEQFTATYPDMGAFAKMYMNIEGDDWQASLREMAQRMVQKDMITHAIGELEGIESVTEEEYQAEVDYWVKQYSGYMTADEIVKSMGELYLRESAFAIKMADWLMERATFTFE